MTHYEELRAWLNGKIGELSAKIEELKGQLLKTEEELKAIDVVEKIAQSVGLGGTAGAATAAAPAPEPVAEPAAAEEAPKKAEKISFDRPTFELGEKEAILAVLSTFEKPLEPAKIVEELTAVVYSFGERNPVSSVKTSLEELITQGAIVKLAPIRPTVSRQAANRQLPPHRQTSDIGWLPQHPAESANR